jgi:ABC-type multidrug transport system ATPase subunit
MGTGKSSILRRAVAEAIEAGERPITWLPNVSDVGLRTERVQFPDMDVATRLGAEVFSGKLIRNLSSGERQRVRLALALSTQGGLVAFDEPCRHLDPEHVEALSRLLLDRAGSGTRVLVSDLRRQLSPEIFEEDIGENGDDGPVRPVSSPEGRDSLGVDIPIPFSRAYQGKPRGTMRLELEKGSLIGLRGRNGSGKTSLLEALARALRQAGKSVGYSRQEPEHQVFACTPKAELNALSHRYLSKNIDDFANRLDIESWLDTPTVRLPLGVLSLLGTWIALEMGRDCVLLDEPSQGLDLRRARILAEELAAFAGQGARIVVASHDPELIRVATRTWSVREGILEVDGER